jgi:hypothetical protein
VARGRMLNKKIGMNGQFNSLPTDTCRLFATWMIPHLDIRGVMHADPQTVRSLVFPRRQDVSNEMISGYLEAMAEVSLIVRFEADGEQWLYWPGFGRNQVGVRYDRELPEFPPPPGWVEMEETDTEHIPHNAGKVPAEGKGREVKRSEKKLSEGADAPTPPRHPAIEVYRTKALRYPDKAQWPAIARIVGVAEDDLEFWGRVVEGYILLGWNKLNISGMLEFYGRREIPKRAQYNGKATGNAPSTSADTRRADPEAAAAVNKRRAEKAAMPSL